MAWEPHPRAWEEERDRKLSSLTWDSQLGKVGLKPVDTTHCVWTMRQLDTVDDRPPLGMVIAYVDDLIAVGDQSQLDCMKAELDKLYVYEDIRLNSCRIPTRHGTITVSGVSD